MTVPLDTPDPDKRLAGARRSIDQLLKRQQTPDGGSQISFAILEGAQTMGLGPTLDKWWFDLGPPGLSDFTNVPDTFAVQTRTIAAGAPNANSGVFGGLSIKQPGMYVAFKNILISSLYNDTTLRSITLYHGGGAFSYTSDMVFGDQHHINQGHGQHFEVWSVDPGDVPTGAILMNATNGESSAYSSVVTLFVIRLDPVSIVL